MGRIKIKSNMLRNIVNRYYHFYNDNASLVSSKNSAIIGETENILKTPQPFENFKVEWPFKDLRRCGKLRGMLVC